MAKYNAIRYTGSADANRFGRPWRKPQCIWRDCREDMADDMPMCLYHAGIIAERWRMHMFAPIHTCEYRPDLPKIVRPPYVYYLMIGPATVKIGTTIQLRQRIASLRTDLQYVVALECGGRDVEYQRHVQFAAERYGRREDFRLSDNLKSHIESLQPHRDELVEIACQFQYEDNEPRSA